MELLNNVEIKWFQMGKHLQQQVAASCSKSGVSNKTASTVLSYSINISCFYSNADHLSAWCENLIVITVMNTKMHTNCTLEYLFQGQMLSFLNC